jgi:hypothetical protein
MVVVAMAVAIVGIVMLRGSGCPMAQFRHSKFGPRKFDSRNYPPQCQRWRERPSNCATNDAIRTSNYAAQLNGIQIVYQASERAENHFS